MDRTIKVFDYKKKFLITPKNALEYADKIGEFLKAQLVNSGKDGYVIGLSGGLDSTVAAYLCKRAGIELYVLTMSETQTKSTDSEFLASKVVANLGLGNKAILINVKPTSEDRRIRQRMFKLRDFARAHRLFVLGTDNLNKNCLGYSAKYGDGASDVEPLQFCLKREIRFIGRALGVPEAILAPMASAELPGSQTDEGNLGVTYAAFDDWALTGSSGSSEIDEKITQCWCSSQHKRQLAQAFNA